MRLFSSAQLASARGGFFPISSACTDLFMLRVRQLDSSKRHRLSREHARPSASCPDLHVSKLDLGIRYGFSLPASSRACTELAGALALASLPPSAPFLPSFIALRPAPAMSAHAPTLSRLHSQDGSSHEDKRSLEETPDTTRAPSRPEPVRRMGEIDVSMGVARMEVINSCLTTPLRAWLMFCASSALFHLCAHADASSPPAAFLVAYAYGLDATVRGTLQSYATSSFQNHSLLATVNVLKSIVAAASYVNRVGRLSSEVTLTCSHVQPAYSKIADTFGRPEVVLFSVVMVRTRELLRDSRYELITLPLQYVIGTIVEATSTNIQSFCAGAVLYQFGYSAAILIVEVIISDLTSLRSRLFFSYAQVTAFFARNYANDLALQLHPRAPLHHQLLGRSERRRPDPGNDNLAGRHRHLGGGLPVLLPLPPRPALHRPASS